ncbi:MAG: T9SS type A sorting domain-containing protein [candidate division WOR-3 bacterium]|nr:T9SS type A sorting domain-containing protein [candidate division WOR-3 bacterium]MDW8150034.1 T9SS type A sorting domain-containing protein [candidate division WOR-3 bacterium]
MLVILIVETNTKAGKINNLEEITSNSNYYIPKIDHAYKVAPFFGWTPEKEEIANSIRNGKLRVDEIFLLNRISRLDSFYNELWKKEKHAVCERYSIKGLSCPEQHIHMERIYHYYNKWKNQNDAWAYAEMVTLIEDGERLLSAYVDLENSKKVKNVPPATTVEPHPEIQNKSFPKDSFRILTDGANWNTFAIANSVANEYNPTIVQVGREDTLIAGLSVRPCNNWCLTNFTGECILISRSVNAGQTWNPLLCIVPPSNNPYNVGEVAIGADPYRRLFVVAYTSDYYYPDYDIGQITFRANGTVVYNTWVDISTVSTLTPYVNAEFNWGRSGCEGQPLSGSCTCSADDNWFYIGMNKGGGVRIYRSTTCGSSWSQIYDGPARTGSAYANNQIMLETTNDPRSGSSVCASSNGGDNTIQAVYGWRNSTTDHRITHLYTDINQGWGNTWTETNVLANYSYPINQPWLAVARRLTTTNTTHFLVFESQYSSTDGDIRYIRASGIPPGTWSAVQNIDYTTVDSRTPTVHTDARWQFCPGAASNTANFFHVAFYHRCQSIDNSLCNDAGYNNTFRVAVLRYNWDLTQRGPEVCGNLVADTIAIPPPPAYSNGGLWQNWWQINGTTFRTSYVQNAPWWFGTMWVYIYRQSPLDLDMMWTILSHNCITPVSSNELKEGKDFLIRGKNMEIYIKGDWKFIVYDVSGKKILERTGKGESKLHLNLPKGVYIYKLNQNLGKFVI